MSSNETNYSVQIVRQKSGRPLHTDVNDEHFILEFNLINGNTIHVETHLSNNIRDAQGWNELSLDDLATSILDLAIRNLEQNQPLDRNEYSIRINPIDINDIAPPDPTARNFSQQFKFLTSF